MLATTEEYILSTMEALLVKSEKDNNKIFLIKDSINDTLYIRKDFYDKSALNIHKKLMTVKHKNLPEIFYVIEQAEGFVVIEEYIHGISLKEKIGCLSQNQVRDYFLTICEILEVLHSMGPPIIHRDIKPSNILLSNDGVIKLIDFDASKEYKVWKTEDTTMLGTKAYAAPEQFGYAKTDNRTDIYCLGATIFHLLTGDIYSHTNNTDTFAGSLSEIIKKCVQIDPGNRYQHIKELKRDLINIARVDTTISTVVTATEAKREEKVCIFPDLQSASRLKKAILIPIYIITTLFIGLIIFFPTTTENSLADTWLMTITFIISPYVLICNFFDIRGKLPLFKKKTIFYTAIEILGIVVVLFGVTVIGLGVLQLLRVIF